MSQFQKNKTNSIFGGFFLEFVISQVFQTNFQHFRFRLMDELNSYLGFVELLQVYLSL